MLANTRNMPNPKHSDRPQTKPAGLRPAGWTRKFNESRDISFRLDPRYAQELAEVSRCAGVTPNEVVRDMVVLSLQARIRQRRGESRL